MREARTWLPSSEKRGAGGRRNAQKVAFSFWCRMHLDRTVCFNSGYEHWYEHEVGGSGTGFFLGFALLRFSFSLLHFGIQGRLRLG